MAQALATKEPPSVYDREQLVALARKGHLIQLPSEAAWMAMSSADRRSLIAAIQAFGEEAIAHRRDMSR